jgi:hypothetical protein
VSFPESLCVDDHEASPVPPMRSPLHRGGRTLLPLHAFLKRGYVRQVMLRMPLVHRQRLVQRKQATLRMNEGPRKIFWLHRPQQVDPPGMQRGEQLQRNLDRGYREAWPKRLRGTP